MNHEERAIASLTVLAPSWRRRRGDTLSQSRGEYTLHLDDAPALIRNSEGRVIGVDAMVRLFRGRTEQRVDPHRICVNPPLQVVKKQAEYRTLDNGDPVLVNSREVEHNPEQAYWDWLWQSVIGTPNPKGWRTRGTVTTVFATAPGGNGYVRYQGDTYADCRTGTGTASPVAGDTHIVGQINTGSSPVYIFGEAFVIFDTSGVPDADDVSNVVLSLYGNFDTSATDFTAIAVASSYDGGPVVAGDFVDGSTLSGLTSLATWASSGYSAAYNAFTSAGAAFNSAINKTGNTALMLFSDRQRDGTVPSGAERVSFLDADSTGTTNDPKLDITHASAVTIGSPLAGARHLATSGILSGRLAS